jgi:hypothetical protein
MKEDAHLALREEKRHLLIQAKITRLIAAEGAYTDS